jgi:S1-C subfamily serine protease
MKPPFGIWLAIALLTGSLYGCSALPEPLKPPSPAPTVDVEATVQARLQEERAKLATATPQPEAPSSEAAAAAALLPSVVRISISDAMGSGLVIGDGLVITNRHVVSDQQTVTVQTKSGQSIPGKVAIRNSILDVALVQVLGLNAPVAPLADVSKMKPGDTVLALGYPLDLKGDATVTRGLFSAVRVGEPLPGEWVQTDAAVNPGNSGGPLANLRGEAVGLITMRQMTEDLTPVQGINFALSATSIREALPAMMVASGFTPPGATPVDETTSKDVADFLQKYDDAESRAFSSSDSSIVQDLCAPGLFSFVSSMLEVQKALNIHRESKLLDFKLLSAYSLPGDMVVADVLERWHSLTYSGNTLTEDEGETDQPQVVSVKRVSGGWQLAAVQFKDDDAFAAATPTPTRAPSQRRPTATPIPRQRPVN